MIKLSNSKLLVVLLVNKLEALETKIKELYLLIEEDFENYQDYLEVRKQR